jgi:hypothetical protein
MLLCEFATETNAGWILENPLSAVLTVPTSAMDFGLSLTLYAQLTGGAGAYNLGAIARAFDSKYILGRSKYTQVEFPSERDMIVEVAFEFYKFTVQRSELYEFQLMANHSEIVGGGVYVSILRGD